MRNAAKTYRAGVVHPRGAVFEGHLLLLDGANAQVIADRARGDQTWYRTEVQNTEAGALIRAIPTKHRFDYAEDALREIKMAAWSLGYSEDDWRLD